MPFVLLPISYGSMLSVLGRTSGLAQNLDDQLAILFDKQHFNPLLQNRREVFSILPSKLIIIRLARWLTCVLSSTLLQTRGKR
jgi:hypothetical protein